MANNDLLLSNIKATLNKSRAATSGGGSCFSAALSTWPTGTPETRPHSSLLTTPASRDTGGRLTAQPSPSILQDYERRLEMEAGYTFRSTQLAAAGGGAAARGGGGNAGCAPTRFTPRDPSPFRRDPGAGSLHATAATAGRSQRPASAIANIGGSSSDKQPSLLDRYRLGKLAPPSTGAGSAGSPYYRPSPAAAKLGVMASLARSSSPSKLGTMEQLRQLSLDCSLTAARNSAAVASRRTTSLGGHPASQQPQQQDFHIAAFPSSRPLPGIASAWPRPPGSTMCSGGSIAPAEREEQEDSDPVTISLRLTPMFDAMPVQPGKAQDHAAGSAAADQGSAQRAQQQEPAASQGSNSASPVSTSMRLAAEPATGEGGRTPTVLLSRINELEAQLQLECMKTKDMAACTTDLREQRDQLQHQVQQQAAAVDAARQRAAEAEAQLKEAVQEAAALRGEVHRRWSVHSDSIDSIARVQAVSQVQRQELEELRLQVTQLNEAWEQENTHVARLQQQLRQTLAANGISERELAQKVHEVEAGWEQRLQEVQQQAQERQQELSDRCQLALIEKAAHERAAHDAASKQQAAEERCVAAEARWRQLAAEMDAVVAESEGQGLQLLSARRHAEDVGEAARQLQRQLVEQQQRCEELEEMLEGEQERSSSIAARADTAEVTQQGLGSHIKVAHARLQQLQEQVAEAQRECRQLRGENDELRLAQTSSQSSYEIQLSAAQSQLADVEQERDQLRQQLAKVTADLEAQLQSAGQHRQQVAAAQQAERDAQAALERQEAVAAQQAQQALAAQVRHEALEAHIAQLGHELQEARQVAAVAEDRLAKAGRNGIGTSPLRDVVSGLRMELQEKDLQLMQVHEDLSRERSKGQELQKQVLDQALELDELQRDISDAFGLRQQLAAAQEAEAQLRKEVQLLRKQASAAAASGAAAQDNGELSPRGSGSIVLSSAVRGPQGRPDGTAWELVAARQEIAKLMEERDGMRDELAERDTEVMQLQGQLVMLQEQVPDDNNWLSPLPDPYS